MKHKTLGTKLELSTWYNHWSEGHIIESFVIVDKGTNKAYEYIAAEGEVLLPLYENQGDKASYWIVKIHIESKTEIDRFNANEIGLLTWKFEDE